MSPGQIALAAASSVLAVSLLVLMAAWLRRPPSGPSQSLAATVKAAVQSVVAPIASPSPSTAEDPLGALLDRVLAERERAARARLLAELVDGDVDVALERLRSLLVPKAAASSVSATSG